MSKTCIIIGAGIGGIATAGLLARAGYDVHVYEKELTAGGRAGTLKIDGFTFDTGPSWYLMPSVFDHYYELMGEQTSDHLQLKKLTPAYKVFYENAEPIIVTSGIEKDAATFDAIEPGAGAALKRYVARSQTIYRLSIESFLYTNFERISDFINRRVFRKAGLLPMLLTTPIHSYVSRYVRDQRLRQILEYPMVFLGTSPFSAPAMYSLMSALDFDEGVYYPQGGMYTIIKSMEEIAKKNGVTFHFESDVERIIARDKKATGIQLGDGSIANADIVISNADLHHTEMNLLADTDRSYGKSYWSRRQAGPSALLLYIGIDGKVPEFEHHNLLFVDDWKGNFEAIYDGGTLPERASIYISKTSHTDPSVAPEGKENLFILVPLPAGVDIDPARHNELARQYLEQIEAMTGVQLKDRIVVQQAFGPNDFLTQYHSWRSSMLGQSHILRQSAFFRTPNKSKKVRNLYYVGGSTTPGIGLPMCLIGAELVYKRIIGDKKGGRVQTMLNAGEKS